LLLYYYNNKLFYLLW